MGLNFGVWAHYAYRRDAMHGVSTNDEPRSRFVKSIIFPIRRIILNII